MFSENPDVLILPLRPFSNFYWPRSELRLQAQAQQRGGHGVGGLDQAALAVAAAGLLGPSPLEPARLGGGYGGGGASKGDRDGRGLLWDGFCEASRG